MVDRTLKSNYCYSFGEYVSSFFTACSFHQRSFNVFLCIFTNTCFLQYLSLEFRLVVGQWRVHWFAAGSTDWQAQAIIWGDTWIILLFRLGGASFHAGYTRVWTILLTPLSWEKQFRNWYSYYQLNSVAVEKSYYQLNSVAVGKSYYQLNSIAVGKSYDQLNSVTIEKSYYQLNNVAVEKSYYQLNSVAVEKSYYQLNSVAVEKSYSLAACVSLCTKLIVSLHSTSLFQVLHSPRITDAWATCTVFVCFGDGDCLFLCVYRGWFFIQSFLALVVPRLLNSQHVSVGHLWLIHSMWVWVTFD